MPNLCNLACFHCKAGIFFSTSVPSSVLSYIHRLCIFNFQSLIFPKPFHFLVTLFSTLFFSVCFCLQTASPSPLLREKELFVILLSPITFSFILHPQGGRVPPPRSDRSTLTEFSHPEGFQWDFWMLQERHQLHLLPVTMSRDQTWHVGARKSNGLPPAIPIPQTFGGICIRSLPHMGGNLPPFST